MERASRERGSTLLLDDDDATLATLAVTIIKVRSIFLSLSLVVVPTYAIKMNKPKTCIATAGSASGTGTGSG